MDAVYKKQIAFRLAVRASSGLYFIEDFLYRHSAEDGAFFRSLCILLSYSFELLLKAQFVATSEFNDKAELERSLKDLNHDILKISAKLGSSKLNAIGINCVNPRSGTDFIGYDIVTIQGKKISVENFIDIRYDFTNDTLRDLPTNGEFTEWVTEALNVYGKIKKQHFS